MSNICHYHWMNRPKNVFAESSDEGEYRSCDCQNFNKEMKKFVAKMTEETQISDQTNISSNQIKFLPFDVSSRCLGNTFHPTPIEFSLVSVLAFIENQKV